MDHVPAELIEINRVELSRKHRAPALENYMNIAMKNPLSLKLSAFAALTDKEIAALERLNQKRLPFAAGREMVHQGQTDRAAYILVSGWACSYKLQPDGTRQIVDFQIPGDFLGFRSVLLHSSDYSFEPIVDILAIEIPKQFLLDAFWTTPRLATAFLWAASRDEAMVFEHLVRLGRRDASKRIAHFLLELGARLTLVGLGSTAGYDCPLTQYHLADALGLTPIHVNRVLRSLREAGLVSFRGSHVKFLDHVGLMRLADFDPAYLDQAGPLAA